jgi:hypothetical protein
MLHQFWLFEEGVVSYSDYLRYMSRKDAPINLHDDLLWYLADSLSWIPTLNPAKPGFPSGHGLNWFGPTIIEQSGAAILSQICLSWSQLFSCGPKDLHLRGLYTLKWPFDEEEHLVKADHLSRLGHYDQLEVNRDECVDALTTLARFGEQTATGKYFIMHLGV